MDVPQAAFEPAAYIRGGRAPGGEHQFRRLFGSRRGVRRGQPQHRTLGHGERLPRAGRLPRLGERLVQKRPPGTHQRLGLAEVRLHRRIITQLPPGAAGDLGRRQIQQSVDRMAGNAERDCRQPRCEQGDSRQGIERPRFHWRFSE